MNRQTFHEYLEEPSKLYQLSLTELQGLVLDYPYSSNLRLLLLLKARLEGHPKAELITSQVAARTFDRAHLYHLLSQLETEAEGETLELKGLEDLEMELLEATPTESQDLEVSEQQGPLSIQPPPFTPTAPDLDDSAAVVEQPELPTVDQSSAQIAATDRTETAEMAKSDTERSSASATDASRSLAVRLNRLKRRQLSQLVQQEADSPEATLKQIARRSIARHRGVASETLAKLLVGQGQYQRAIKMYEELSLAHPEKKPIFAPLIKELKEKL